MTITRKALAAGLGISPAAVTKHAKRGMPTDTIERAQRWRDRHLDPARTVSGRADYIESRQPARVGTADPMDDVALAVVERLGLVACALLERDAFADIEGELRAALRAVPPRRRSEVGLDARVWRALLTFAPWLRPVAETEHERRGRADDQPAADELTDEQIGAIMYHAAAGELALDDVDPRAEGTS